MTDEHIIEAMARAAYLAYCRGYPEVHPPEDWWSESDYEDYKAPERDWDAEQAGTHIRNEGFRECAAASLAAYRACTAQAIASAYDPVRDQFERECG